MGIVKKLWYPVLVALAVLLIAMTFYAASVKAQPVCVSAECGDPHHAHSQPNGKRDDRWVVPVAVVAAATVAIAAWIWNHEKKLAAPDPEPVAAQPAAQERILTITPDVKVYQ